MCTISFYQFSLCRLRVTRAAAVMSWVELGSAGADEGPAVLCESVQDIVQVECALSDHLQGLAGGSGRARTPMASSSHRSIVTAWTQVVTARWPRWMSWCSDELSTGR